MGTVVLRKSVNERLKMLSRILAAVAISINLAVAPAIASDWVEDDQLNGFYKHQVNKTSGQPEPGYQVPSNSKPTYRTLGGNQNQSPSVFDTSNGYQSGGSSTTQSMGNFASPLTVPANPTPYENNFSQQPKKKGFFGKLGSFGKSVAQLPADAVEGAGAMLSSPLFWQSAGALAGAGANAYMANQYYRNNPGIYNPYYGGFGGGYNPFIGGYGYGAPGLGYGGLYGNRLGYGGLGYGGLYGNRYGYGGLGYGGGLYGGYNPYFGRGFAAPGSLNQFGSLAPSTPAGRAFRQNYNRQVNNSGLSNYDKYWLRKNPNYSLFGY